MWLQNVWNRLKQELLQGVMPVFLANHPNSAQVLTYCWHVSVSKNISLKYVLECYRCT